jgi:hypothetical protein
MSNNAEVCIWTVAQLSIHGKADDVNVDGVGKDVDEWCVVVCGTYCDAGGRVAEVGAWDGWFGGLEGNYTQVKWSSSRWNLFVSTAHAMHSPRKI